MNEGDAARFAAFTELDGFRSTVDVLRARIGDLEGLLSKAFHASPAAFQNSLIQQPIATTSQIPYDNNLLLLQQQQQQQIQFQEEQLQQQQQQQERRETSSVNDGSSEMNRDDLRGEEVEASVALEFLALGRHRAFGAGVIDQPIPSTGAHRIPTSNPSPYASPTDIPESTSGGSDFIPSPSALYPTIESLERASPSRLQADALIAHSIDWMSWHHSALHAPTFRSELEEFWDWGERRFEICNPAWLALWYALLVVGVANLAQGQGQRLGISEGEIDVLVLSQVWFDY